MKRQKAIIFARWARWQVIVAGIAAFASIAIAVGIWYGHTKKPTGEGQLNDISKIAEPTKDDMLPQPVTQEITGNGNITIGSSEGDINIGSTDREPPSPD